MTSEMVEHSRSSVLARVFAAATERASIAMARWTNGQVRLALDEVCHLEMHEVSTELGLPDDLVTLVALHIEGVCEGDLILTFDVENGRRLAAGLLNRQPAESDTWTAVEQSALMETGNILGSAYLNELTRLTNLQLLPSPPYFLQDYAASVVQQAIMPQAMVTNNITIGRTRFLLNERSVNWNVLFVPSMELLAALEASCATSVS